MFRPTGSSDRMRNSRHSERQVELDSRVALVTGAGTRVGRVIALALGRAGMRVGVHYSGSAKGARKTAEEIIAAGRDAGEPSCGLTDSPTPPGHLAEHHSG